MHVEICDVCRKLPSVGFVPAEVYSVTERGGVSFFPFQYKTPTQIKICTRCLQDIFGYDTLRIRAKQAFEAVKKEIASWQKRQEQCIGTDAKYTNKQMLEMISAAVKSNYEKDNYAFTELIKSLEDYLLK